MNIDDRRVRKTKKALRDALVKLMEDKELRSITVRELTDTADIHRATFYVHYKDVYDLYEQLENSVIKEIDHIIMSESTYTYEEIYKNMINYVYDNPSICRMFIGSKCNCNFQNRVSKLLEDNYLKIWLYEDGKTEITEEMRYLTSYHIQGCISIISRWIDSEFYCHKNDIINIIKKVDMSLNQII